MRSDRERLLDILEAIEKIEKRVGPDQKAFERDELLQVWAVHYLQIIGEAGTRLSEQLRTKHLEIPWGNIIGMRHILVHGYFDLDLEIVWKAVIVDLPALKPQIEAIVGEIVLGEQ
jgi:uncharacterized protein with HEPN domain